MADVQDIENITKTNKILRTGIDSTELEIQAESDGLSQHDRQLQIEYEQYNNEGLNGETQDILKPLLSDDTDENASIPMMAIDQDAEISSIVEELSGGRPGEGRETIEEELEEELEEEGLKDTLGENTGKLSTDVDPLPNLEIEHIDEDKNKDKDTAKIENETSTIDDPVGKDSDQIPFDDREKGSETDSKYEVPTKDQPESDINENQQMNAPLPGQMVQTNLAGGLGHAFGSVLNGIFSGIGMALGSGLAGIKHTKNALDIESKPSVSTKFEAGAHFHFNPATRAVNDSFNNDTVNEWKKNRLDSEFDSLQLDIDSQLSAIDKMKKTEWAKKLKSIEESNDPETKIRAPAILNMAKAKIDFKDADKDMSYFIDQIQQRSERIATIAKESNQGYDRLEEMISKWQNEAKINLEEISEAKEGQGFLERIQNTANAIISKLRAIFSKPSNSVNI
ncbi:hypothetical protein [Microbulbifer epialgicus]|uniref:Uncharacterized protein n=1 Tax=Microbulbifer epialgicus TaxID=393907 RepID=A0ABV4NUG1_9GAMM